MNNKRKIGEVSFDTLNTLLLLVLAIICIYPFIYVLFSSVSEPAQLMRQRGILLWPLGFTLKGYEMVFSNSKVVIGYANTLFYTVFGSVINVFLTAMSAYVVSRKNFYWKKALMFFIVFTMFFHGGLIPFFLKIRDYDLLDKRLALILPTAISTWNLIVTRTAFAQVPDSLPESAKIDGAGEFTIFHHIMVPLVKPTLAVITLFYAVGHWNSWFNAMLFLQDRNKFPLQLVLREILILNNTEMMTAEQAMVMDEREVQSYADLVQYATIIVATVPILCLYPFLQKYFVKGVMIGSIKG